MSSASAVRLSPSVEKQKLKLELLRGSRLKLESLPVSVVVHEHLVRAGCMFFGTATRRTLTRLHRPYVTMVTYRKQLQLSARPCAAAGQRTRAGRNAPRHRLRAPSTGCARDLVAILLAMATLICKHDSTLCLALPSTSSCLSVVFSVLSAMLLLVFAVIGLAVVVSLVVFAILLAKADGDLLLMRKRLKPSYFKDKVVWVTGASSGSESSSSSDSRTRKSAMAIWSRKIVVWNTSFARVSTRSPWSVLQIKNKIKKNK